eukprot:scaffold4151_cov30-Phaeocystis_antarctica.AAC.1
MPMPCRRCRLFHADATHAAHARQRRTRPALALEVESEDMYSPSVPHQNAADHLEQRLPAAGHRMNLNDPQYALPNAAHPP